MNNCNCCFTDTIGKCNEAINVLAYLPTPLSEAGYRWVITDKFNNRYEGDVVILEDNTFSIPVAELPAGMLNQYNGSFKLEIIDAESCKPVNFKIGMQTDCIAFSITGGTYVKDTLGCELPASPAP